MRWTEAVRTLPGVWLSPGVPLFGAASRGPADRQAGGRRRVRFCSIPRHRGEESRPAQRYRHGTQTSTDVVAIIYFTHIPRPALGSPTPQPLTAYPTSGLPFCRGAPPQTGHPRGTPVCGRQMPVPGPPGRRTASRCRPRSQNPQS
uniref:Uncharacterized protein n=1 Tax=Human herpesvirus 1 TaxID=10298 RepID=A0A2Z4GZU9_HHV1|nr:hypothetical protein [Human alphaherpesvirus 1]